MFKDHLVEYFIGNLVVFLEDFSNGYGVDEGVVNQVFAFLDQTKMARFAGIACEPSKTLFETRS